jgi:hypothetical protein
MVEKMTNDENNFDFWKNWHWKMSSASGPTRVYKKEDEDFYFSDVDNTRTQLSGAQLDEVKKKYDIPISTKLSYAIIEQILSMLTGTKPYMKLLAVTDAPEEVAFTEIYESLINGIWFESKTNEQLTFALRDCLMSGEGYIHVRKSNFWNESTFNVIHEYVPWNNVYIDPNSKKSDYSDAEMMCIAKIISKDKAEAEYDVTIPQEDLITKDNGWGMGIEFGQLELPYYTWSSQYTKGSDSYVWIREFYRKKNTWVYISDDGKTASSRPKPTEIPNAAKAQLGQQIAAMQQELAQVEKDGHGMAQSNDAMNNIAVQQDDPTTAVQAAGESQQGMQEANDQANQMTDAIKKMIVQFTQMPDTVPGYMFTDLGGNESLVEGYQKLKKKHIIRCLCVGNKIYERDILFSDEYPIISFNISHNKSPNKVYSMTHYFKDIVKALNKFWSISIYDAQLHGQRKVIMEESTVVDMEKWQNDWAMPGAVLTYKMNPILSDGGKPMIMEPAPMNQAYTQMLVLLQQLAEYITGIFSVMQGNAQGNVPDTMGGIQSMQAAGGQRIKLYSRYFETSLERMAYVTVCYAQQYTPRDMVMKYFDENGDGAEVKVMDSPSDIKFKVRCQLTANLPTTQLLAAQLMSSVSGQTKNPAVADLLTKQMIKNLNMPDGDKLIKDIDTVTMMQNQINQLNQQLQDANSKLNMMQNNQASAEIGMKQRMAEQQMQMDMKQQLADHKAQLESQQQTIPTDF